MFNNKLVVHLKGNINEKKHTKMDMNINIEWDGLIGLIKFLLIFIIPFSLGFFLGRRKMKINSLKEENSLTI
ncbi:MAG: Uncharacterised protein [Owenweeksia sp. TMED14]|nr:MAG: Uncharacterised protein [Owenweeksia sp. TMED14]